MKRVLFIVGIGLAVCGCGGASQEAPATTTPTNQPAATPDGGAAATPDGGAATTPAAPESQPSP